MPHAYGGSYHVALALVAWLYVFTLVFLYTLTAFPALTTSNFIFWHALHPVLPVALMATTPATGIWWALVVAVILLVIECVYGFMLAFHIMADPLLEKVWLAGGSLAFFLLTIVAIIVLLTARSHWFTWRRRRRRAYPRRQYRQAVGAGAVP